MGADEDGVVWSWAWAGSEGDVEIGSGMANLLDLLACLHLLNSCSNSASSSSSTSMGCFFSSGRSSFFCVSVGHFFFFFFASGSTGSSSFTLLSASAWASSCLPAPSTSSRISSSMSFLTFRFISSWTVKGSVDFSASGNKLLGPQAARRQWWVNRKKIDTQKVWDSRP